MALLGLAFWPATASDDKLANGYLRLELPQGWQIKPVFTQRDELLEAEIWWARNGQPVPVSEALENDELAALLRKITFAAVRTHFKNCSGHIFHRYADSGLVEVRRGHSLTLSADDHYRYYCFKIGYEGLYDYAGSFQNGGSSIRIDTIPGRIGRIGQSGGYLQVETEPASFRNAQHSDWSYVKVTDELLRREGLNWSNYYLGSFESAFDGDGCNGQLFESLADEPAGSPHIPQRLRPNQPLRGRLKRVYAPFAGVSLALEGTDKGYRYCFKVSDRKSGVTDYKLSHIVTSVTAAYKPLEIETILVDILPPRRFDLAEALKLLSAQLTPEGRRMLEQTKIQLINADTHELGSRIGDSGGGAYVNQRERLKVWQLVLSNFNDHFAKPGQILLSEELFPADYTKMSDLHKSYVAKWVIHALSHELLHAVDDETGFREAYRQCRDRAGLLLASQAFRMSSELFDAIYGQNGSFTNVPLATGEEISDYRQFWSIFENCLFEFPDSGPIYEALREAFIGLSDAGSLNHNQVLLEMADVSARWGDKRHLGSYPWYIEVYAELPLLVPDLGPVLEEYYEQFFEDRQQFFEILTEDGRFWEYGQPKRYPNFL